MRLDAYASAVHFVDHIAVLWNGLEAAERGQFYVRGREAWNRAVYHGVTPKVGRLPRSRNRVLVASWGDTPSLGYRRWVMIEHGSGQSYSEPHPDAEPEWGHTCGLDLILTPNSEVARRNRIYHPHAMSAVVGSAKVERLVRLRAESTRTVPRAVAFAWHWNAPGPGKSAMWAWPIWRDAVAELAAMTDDERGYRLIGHGHPRAMKYLTGWYKRIGVECVPDFEVVIRRADVLVADNTSALWESAACGVPLVILDAPWYDGATGEPRFGVGRDAGVRVGSGTAVELHDAITVTLRDDPCAVQRERVSTAVYNGDLSGSLERSLTAIRALD